MNGSGVSKARKKVRRYLYFNGFLNGHVPLDYITIRGYTPPAKKVYNRLEKEITYQAEEKILEVEKLQLSVKRKRGRPRKITV